MTIPDDLSKMILVSIRIPWPEPEPTDPALLISAFAGGVLGDLFAVELAAKNLLVERPMSGPRSFPGDFLFAVGDVRIAASSILSVLQRNGLKPFATVFRFDIDEFVWRSIYPPGLTMLHSVLLTEAVAMDAKAKDTAALWEQVATSLNPPGNDATGQ